MRERGEKRKERESLYFAENSQLRSSVEELKTLMYEARAQHFSQLDELRFVAVDFHIIMGPCVELGDLF